MRLQKFLARAGAASRRHSEQAILDGRVCVNGEVVRELGTKVDPACDRVSLDGKAVQLSTPPVVVALNKPAGCLTTMSDPQGRPCVGQLDVFARFPGLFPVGRLDKDTTGLLVLTNDGVLGYKLAHPKYHVDKTYVAHVQGVVGEERLRMLERGVEIYDAGSGKTVVTAPAKVRLLKAGKNSSVLEITIHEGMNRQVKRMCAAIGHPVSQLERTTLGPLRIEGLAPGGWRVLSPAEVESLSCACGDGC